MCEQSSWSKSCVAELPVGDRATAFEGDAPDPPLLKKQEAVKKAQQIAHFSVAMLALCKGHYQCGYLC